MKRTPFFSKQREQREVIKEQTERIAGLEDQLTKSQQRTINAEHLLKTELTSHAKAEQTLSGVQENLKNCVTYLQETVQPMLITYQGRIADLEESNGDYLAYVQAVEEARRKRQRIPNFTEFQHQKGAVSNGTHPNDTATVEFL